MLVRLLSNYYWLKLRRGHTVDAAEDVILRRLVSAGARVLDVGANFGAYTALFANFVGREGEVHAFEPVPLTCEILRRATHRLGLRNVHVHNLAISDTNDTGFMEIPSFPDGGPNPYQARLVRDFPSRSLSRPVPVRIMRLDDLSEVIGKTVDFVKIDVEGHEAAVIRGGQRLIERDRPALLMEVSSNLDDVDNPQADTYAWLAEKGYGCFSIDSGDIRLRAHGERSVNYLFLLERHVRAHCASATAEIETPKNHGKKTGSPSCRGRGGHCVSKNDQRTTRLEGEGGALAVVPPLTA
jgi:FkbM family methyltransferase